MAKVAITMGEAMGGGAPIYAPITKRTLTVTSTASSTVAAITAAGGETCSVTSFDGNIMVAIGKSPVASPTTGYPLQAGGTKDFGPMSPGDTVAIIDA